MLKTIETVIGHWVTLIKAHEKLLLAIVAALVLWHLGDKAYDAYGNHLKAETTVAESRLANVEKATAQIETDLTALKAQVAAKAIADNTKIAAAKQTIVIKQREVAALPLPQLSAEWESLLNVPEGSITPQTNGTISVSSDAAHQTVNQLVTIAPLQIQLDATNDKLLGCNAVSAQQDKDITSLHSQLAEVTTARTAEQKQAKHDIRAAYFKGLKHGLIIGVPVGVALTIAAVIH
jgi:hypothetical protein